LCKDRIESINQSIRLFQVKQTHRETETVGDRQTDINNTQCISEIKNRDTHKTSQSQTEKAYRDSRISEVHFEI